MMDREGFGPFDMKRVGTVWDQVDAVLPAIERADGYNANLGTKFTARRFDEAQTAGKRTYIACGQLLATAIDHHLALRALVTSEHGLTVFAPWTLLRSTFEASIWVHWILESSIGEVRRTRGLRRSCLDHKQYQVATEEMQKSKKQALKLAEDLAEAAQVYRREAEELGIPWSKVYDTMNMVIELPKLDIIKEFFEDAPKLSVTIWRQMSGHAHGYGWAVQSSSKVERSVKIPGGLAVTLTIGDDNFETIVMLVGLLLARAIYRYAQLSEVELMSPTATVL